MIILLSFQAVLLWLVIYCKNDNGVVISSIVLFLLITLLEKVIF